MHQKTIVLEKGVKQPNKHIEMFSKQLNEGRKNFVELDAWNILLSHIGKNIFKQSQSAYIY